MRCRVLITGAFGFLGQPLLTRLEKEGHEVFTLSRRNLSHKPNHYSCDLTNIKQTRETIEQIYPNVIYHLAANPLAKPDYDNPSQIIRDNIEGTNNLLSCFENGERFVFASSVTVYGRFNKSIPACFSTQVNPISLYAMTKAACENLVNIHSDRGLIDGCCIRLPALVGANSTHGLIHDIINKLLEDSPTIELFGEEPGTIKPFVHVNDAAQFFSTMKKYGGFGKPEMVLYGNTDSLTVKEVAEIVMSSLGIFKPISWNPQKTWKGDNKEIWLYPDILPNLNSSDAIRKTIHEYCDKWGLYRIYGKTIG